jgi:uncharacterized membrane protein
MRNPKFAGEPPALRKAKCEMARLRNLLIELRSSLWFLPTLIVLSSGVLAVVLVEIDSRLSRELLTDFPRLFGAGAEGSRGMLSAIASSMITVAGVTFSITIVALSQASNQYSSSILRNFMRDRANQSVLGVFLGVFTYCLIVLRSIRSGEEGTFIPSLSVFTAIILALIGIGFLIFFIHHVVVSIQAANIVAKAAEETFNTIDRLFPEMLRDEEVGHEAVTKLNGELQQLRQIVIPMPKSGYVQSYDQAALVRLACSNDVVIRMNRAIGEFVVADTPLVTVYANSPLDGELVEHSQDAFSINSVRTIEQDSSFGIRQIVDLALKALSPAVNDTSSVLTCIHYLTAINVRLANRRIAEPFVREDGKLRLIVKGPTFETFISESFDEIRTNAGGNATVILHLLLAFKTIATVAENPNRKRLIFKQISLLENLAEKTICSDYDAARVKESFHEFNA